MLEPDEVSAILRLNELGGSKRITRELGISRNTVNYVAAGGSTPYRQPQRKKALAGQDTWLKERLRQRQCRRDPPGVGSRERHHRQPAVQRYRQELAAEARATVRFETPPGK